MKKTVLMVTVATALISAAPAAASEKVDSLDRESRPIKFSRVSAEQARILAKDRPQGSKEIPTPKFVIHTPDNAFMMTIGGQVNPIIGVDMGNALYDLGGQGVSFTTQAIPVPATSGHRSDFFINALGAAVDFQVVGFGGTKNQITGYIKLETNDVDHQVLLSRAYLTWKGITAGEKLTLMQDDYACQPPTIDPEGPSGCVSTVSYEISYTSPSYHGFQYAVGLDMPTYYSSKGYYRGHDFPDYVDKQVSGADASQMVPDIPFWVQWGTGNYNRIRLSGILRTFTYRDCLTEKTCHVEGWGAMVSGNLNPYKPLILYLQAVYGKGIGNYIQDLAGLPLSYVPKDSAPGKMTPSPMMGINFGVTWNFNSKWQANAMASECRIWKVGDYCAALDNSQNYKYALYAAGNVFYNISSYLQLGLEYLYGYRKTWTVGGASDNRLQMQLLFTI